MVIALSLGIRGRQSRDGRSWSSTLARRNDNAVPFLGDNNLVAVGMAMLVPLVIGARGDLGGLAETRLAILQRRRRVSRAQHVFSRRLPVDRRSRRV